MHKLLYNLSPETAHNLAIWALHNGLAPDYRESDDPILASEIFGLKFTNPIGMAAGFDKNARAINGLAKLGFGFVEAGSVTPRQQAGNPKPRIFRLTEDEAIINRLGFNNAGIEEFLKNYAASTAKLKTKPILGINIGANKDSENFYDDYLILIERATPLADYITVNISSPNTPGLRDLQKKEAIAKLLKDVLEIRNAQKRKPPLLVKIAPDLTDEEVFAITDIAQELKLDGIIATNTTIKRPHLTNISANETGGLSGKPLRDTATEIIRKIYSHSNGAVKIIGVGGVASGEDAFEKIAAGASLVQIYTSLIYKGPRVVRDIKHELAAILKQRGFKNLQSAIGTAGK